MDGNGTAVSVRQGPKLSGSEVNAAIGARIRSRRIALGVTQKRLGEAVGVSHAMISDFESGKCGVRAMHVPSMCLALGAMPNELFGWEEAR